MNERRSNWHTLYCTYTYFNVFCYYSSIRFFIKQAYTLIASTPLPLCHDCTVFRTHTDRITLLCLCVLIMIDGRLDYSAERRKESKTEGSDGQYDRPTCPTLPKYVCDTICAMSRVDLAPCVCKNYTKIDRLSDGLRRNWVFVNLNIRRCNSFANYDDRTRNQMTYNCVVSWTNGLRNIGWNISNVARKPNCWQAHQRVVGPSDK